MKNKMLCLLFFGIAAHAQQYPSLSAQSKRTIAFDTLKGSLIGLGGYLVGKTAVSYIADKCFEFPRFSDHKLAYGIAVGLGAAIAGSWSSSHTPEANFTYAKENVLKKIDNQLLLMIVQPNENLVAKIKDVFFEDRFPLVTAYNWLLLNYNELQSYADALQNVLHSYRTDLVEESTELLLIIEIYQNAIKDAVKIIKDDAQFLTQSNAYAQLVSANAAASSAAALWTQAILPQHNYVIIGGK